MKEEMKHDEIYSAAQLTAFIHEVGFLPLLDSGIRAFSTTSVRYCPKLLTNSCNGW